MIKRSLLEKEEDMLFFTIKHCKNLTLAEGHGEGVAVGKFMRMEIVFFAI